ncbi:MAG: molybdenum cofactor guanylyltransferase MobA [Burkholderiaceae bacterium]|nr:molybdenum cofactor guanylyltransferase MobA [Burkholderiaceae bacterium]
MPTRDQITGLVLAGGRGLRMGGIDKGLATWRGEPLVSHVLRRLRPQVVQVAISANRNFEAYRALAPVIADPDPTAFAGPLTGVLAALRAVQTDWLAVVPCDLPMLPADTVTRLAAALGAHADTRAAYAAPAGQTHSLVCLLHRSLATVLERFVADGGQRVRAAYPALGALAVPFADAQAFINLNATADLQATDPR